MIWIKLDTDFDTDPSIVQLSLVGRSLFLLLLRRCKKNKGTVSVSELYNSEYLCMMLGAKNIEHEIEAQIDKLFELGLLYQDDDSVKIKSWDKYQTDSTNAKRQSRYRKRELVSDTAKRLAKLLADEMKKHDCGCRTNPEAWAVDIDKMIRIDKYDPDEIERVITWVVTDHEDGPGWRGWAPNIRSGAKLRSHFDRLRVVSKKTKTVEVNRSSQLKKIGGRVRDNGGTND